jgi:2-polyprenyl-3-methyl-5-hydroxy-6-metoxy-1,4-benzoquinol methylase
MSKAQFLMKTLVKYATLQSTDCPYCHCKRTNIVQWKNGIWQLRQCAECSLNFRFPKDDPEENISFYQKNYKQDKVTDLPREEDISFHITDRFRSVGRDLTTHLGPMRALVPAGRRILDYGCSWGYGVYQLSQAGYDATGFEISRPRVDYGQRTLHVNLTSDIDSLPKQGFDEIYSAHVLEHIPTPRIALRAFQRLLKPGGRLFLYVPNCSGDEAKRLGVKWGQMINEKHVLALTAEFFHKNLPEHGFSTEFTSSPYERSPQALSKNGDLGGEELLVVGTLQS